MEHFLDVYLRTPDLPKHDVARALLARGNARKAAGVTLLAQAQQGMSSHNLGLVGACWCGCVMSASNGSDKRRTI